MVVVLAPTDCGFGLEDAEPAFPEALAAVGDLREEASEFGFGLRVEFGVGLGAGLFEEGAGINHVVEDIVGALGFELGGEGLRVGELAGRA